MSDALRASDLELASLGDRLESAPGPACVLGPGGEILYVNAAWDRRAPGWRSGPLAGRRYADLAGPQAPFVGALCEAARDGSRMEVLLPGLGTDLPETRAIRFEPVRVGGVACVLVVHAS